MIAALEISLVIGNCPAQSAGKRKNNIHQSVDDGNGGLHVPTLQAFNLELLF